MPRLPLAALLALLTAVPTVGQPRFSPTPTPVSPAGTRATVDLPASVHMRNVGGSDGAGLCVFTSLQHAAFWQNVRTLDGFRQWMQARPGGGWPEKVDQMLAQFCRSKGVPVPEYVQHTGGDDTFLDLAVKTDRLPCVTYDGRDDFYRGTIAHMVNLAHIDGRYGAVIDNNRPGVWLWMTRADFLSRWRGNSGGWAVVLLDPPPPPYTALPAAAVAHEWVGSDPAAAPAFCRCRSGDPCECPDGCRCGPVVGQCANGRCPLPAAPAGPAPEAGRATTPPPVGTCPSDRHEWGWIEAVRQYGWRFKAAPEAGPRAGDVLTGVVPGKIHEHPEYSISGRPCSREEALAAVGQGNLADDTDHWHLTAVGPADLCGKVRADVAALPADLRGKLLVQCYAPDHWAVGQFKLPEGVSLRAPSPGRTAPQVGAVGAAEYLAGTTKLTDLLGVSGGPAPAPPKPAPAPGPSPDRPADPKPVSPWLLALLGLGLYLFTRKKG